MAPSESPPDGSAPATEMTGPGACVNFPQDPRCHMLAVVLLAGNALRAMNHVRANMDGGLNAALVLLDILQAEREAAEGAGRPAVATGSGPVARTPRSILAITAAVDVPRETVRRIAAGLVTDGWLQEAAQGGFESSARTQHWFGLDHDLERYAEFVWTAREVMTTLTIAPDGVDALLCLHPWESALATRREAVANPAYRQTLPAIQRWLDGATAGTRERAAGVVDGYLYRHLKRLRATFEGDILLPLIIGEIAHRNVAMLGQNGDSAQWVEKFGSRFGSDASDGHHEFLPTNTYSMSQSMGVPDTTLRRRIAHLRMREWISVDAAGNLTVDGDAVRRHSDLCNLEALNDMVACHRSLVAMGMIA